MTLRIGVDVGGTKIEVIALDATGAELFRKRVPAPRGIYEDTLRAIVGLELSVTRVEAKAKLSQNRSEPDRLGVQDGLALSGRPAGITWPCSSVSRFGVRIVHANGER